MSVNKLVPVLFFYLICGAQSYAQQVDTIKILQQADSLLQLYNMQIPEMYLDDVELEYIESSFVERIMFKERNLKLDTANCEVYKIYYRYRIGDFGYNNLVMLLSIDKNSGHQETYFSESAAYLLSVIKDKDKTFKKLTRDKLIEMIEANGEIRIDSLQDPNGSLLRGWDTLAKNTYFTVSFGAVSLNSSEEIIPERDNELVPIAEIQNAEGKTPIVIIESSDPILCLVEKGGYGIARKHRMYFDINRFLLMYDGFPSFRFFVNIDRF